MHWLNQWLDVPELSLIKQKDKTEVIVFGVKEERLKVNAQLKSVMLKITNQARNLEPDFNSHINIITKSTHNRQKNISWIDDLCLSRIWKNLHLSQVNLTTLRVSLQVSPKNQSGFCSLIRMLMLVTKTNMCQNSFQFWEHYTNFLLINWFLTYCCWFTKHHDLLCYEPSRPLASAFCSQSQN